MPDLINVPWRATGGVLYAVTGVTGVSDIPVGYVEAAYAEALVAEHNDALSRRWPEVRPA